MNEKRCKKCNALLPDGENYCLFCGTKQEETQVVIQQENNQKNTIINKDQRNKKVIFYLLILVLSIGFIQYGIMSKDNFYIGIGMLGFPVVIYFLIQSYKLYDKHIVKKKEQNNLEKLVGFIVLVVFLLGRTYISDLLDEHSIKPQKYTYEIEPGYEYIEPITAEDIQFRLDSQIQKVTDAYEYSYIEEVNDQFIIDIDIMSTNDRKEAAGMFTKLVNYLYHSKANYPYIKSLNVHFYYDDNYLYTARLHNLFLKEVIKLNTDGSFYDAQSNVSVLFKTLNEGYTFPIEMVDYSQTLPSSAEKYLSDYYNWYGDFDEIGQELFDQLDIASVNYIEEGKKPTTTDLQVIESLLRKFKNRCALFDRIETDEYYEVFHQYFSRGCQYYVRAYSNNLDGIKNSSVDRIEYSYLDYNLAHDYFNQIFDFGDEIVGSDA